MTKDQKIDAFVEATINAAHTQLAYQEKLTEWEQRCKPELDPLRDAYRAAYEKAVDTTEAFMGDDLSDDELVAIGRRIAAEVESVDAEDIVAHVKAFTAMQEQYAAYIAEQADSSVVLN